MVDLQVNGGEVKAMVMGSELYRVTVNVSPLSRAICPGASANTATTAPNRPVQIGKYAPVTITSASPRRWGTHSDHPGNADAMLGFRSDF